MDERCDQKKDSTAIDRRKIINKRKTSCRQRKSKESECMRETEGEFELVSD